MGTTTERQTLDSAAKDCGKLIKAFRMAKGLRQEDLARLVGVEQGAVSKWENGERLPRDYHRRELARVLDDTNGVIFRPVMA